MVDKKAASTPEPKKVATTEMVGATGFECGAHDTPFKTDTFAKLQQHLRDSPHELSFGNYPCKICNKTVTIVPDYLDKPSPDSGLSENNSTALHGKYTMVAKRPDTAQVAGGLGVCDDCRKRLRDQLE
jgi:hypothetical protein